MSSEDARDTTDRERGSLRPLLLLLGASMLVVYLALYLAYRQACQVRLVVWAGRGFPDGPPAKLRGHTFTGIDLGDLEIDVCGLSLPEVRLEDAIWFDDDSAAGQAAYYFFWPAHRADRAIIGTAACWRLRRIHVP